MKSGLHSKIVTAPRNLLLHTRILFQGLAIVSMVPFGTRHFKHILKTIAMRFSGYNILEHSGAWACTSYSIQLVSFTPCLVLNNGWNSMLNLKGQLYRVSNHTIPSCFMCAWVCHSMIENKMHVKL